MNFFIDLLLAPGCPAMRSSSSRTPGRPIDRLTEIFAASGVRLAGRSASGARKLRQPTREVLPLRLLHRERKRSLVRRAGLRRAAEAPAKVGPGGVHESIVGEITAGQELVDECKSARRAVAHGD